MRILPTVMFIALAGTWIIGSIISADVQEAAASLPAEGTRVNVDRE